MAAQKASGTIPLVEPDGLGGHVPYVLSYDDPSPEYSAAEAATIGLLQEQLEVLSDIRDECRAMRLLVQELMNEGNRQQLDGLEMALAVAGAPEER